MPLDKMTDSEEFIPTHKSIVLHIQGKPVACIIDKIIENYDKYRKSQDINTKASLMGFLNKHEDAGLLMGCKLKMQIDDDFFEFTVYPDLKFIDAVIFNETIFIINDKLDIQCSLKLLTDQFVKTKIEFDKFQKMLS